MISSTCAKRSDVRKARAQLLLERVVVCALMVATSIVLWACCVGLTGCAEFREAVKAIPLPKIELCYKHDTYGNFCVTIVGDKVEEVQRADDGPPVTDEEREAVRKELEGKVSASAGGD